MALEDHQELVDMLLHITGKAMLSGYDHEVYKPLEEAGWTKLVFEARCWVPGKTRGTKHIYNDSNKHKLKRKECLWVNYKTGYSFRPNWTIADLSDRFQREEKKTRHQQLDLVYMSETRKNVLGCCS